MSSHTAVASVETMPPFFRVLDVAQRLQVSRATLYRLMASGAIESVRVGRCRRIPRAAVVDFESRLAGGDLTA